MPVFFRPKLWSPSLIICTFFFTLGCKQTESPQPQRQSESKDSSIKEENEKAQNSDQKNGPVNTSSIEPTKLHETFPFLDTKMKSACTNDLMITIDISKSDYQSTVTTYKTMDSCKSDPLYIETTDGMYQLQNFDKTLSTYDLKSRSVSGKIKVLNAAGVSAIKKECDLSILSVGDVVDRKKCGGSNKDLYSTWEIRGNLLKVAKCTSQKDGTSSEKRCTDTTGGVWFD